jgi:hypothetical protein
MNLPVFLEARGVFFLRSESSFSADSYCIEKIDESQIFRKRGGSLAQLLN